MTRYQTRVFCLVKGFSSTVIGIRTALVSGFLNVLVALEPTTELNSVPLPIVLGKY